MRLFDELGQERNPDICPICGERFHPLISVLDVRMIACPAIPTETALLYSSIVSEPRSHAPVKMNLV